MMRTGLKRGPTCHHGCSSKGRAEAMAQATAVAGVWPRLQLRQMQGCMAGLAGAPDAGEFPKQPLRAFFFLANSAQLVVET